MDYPLKVDILVGLEYVGLVESLQMNYRDRNINSHEEE